MNVLKSFFGNESNTRARNTSLSVEALEDRQMLSTVDIIAAGTTGEETIELVVAGETVATFENVGGDVQNREFVTLSYEAEYVAAADVEIRFTNDAYDPANGIDRNVLVDRVIIRYGTDGTPEEREFYIHSAFNFEIEDPSVLSTGAWTSADGVVEGFGRGEMLHTNGSFKLDGTPVYRGGLVGATRGYGNGTMVQINAAGSTGDEQFNLLIDDQVVKTFDASSDLFEYRYVTDSPVTADQIKVEFINDLYVPGEVDRNLRVSSIRLNDTLYQTEANTTFSTGTWRRGLGVVPGYPGSETLHTNGYFQFLAGDGESGELTVHFAGQNWIVEGATSASQVIIDAGSGAMAIVGNTEQGASVYREVDVNGGALYEFSFDAFRRIDGGSFNSSSQPWATVGIDFLNSAGQQVAQQTIEVNSPRDANADGLKRKEFLAPDDAVTAKVWIWTDVNPPGTSIPLVLRDIRFDEFVSQDTTPPNIELQRSTITEPTSLLQFVLNVTDGSGLTGIDGPNSEVTLTGPNGFSVDVNSVAGGGLPNGTFFIYELRKPDNALWSTADNGLYTVTVNGGEFQDSVGNVAGTQVVGTFLIDVDNDVQVG